MNIEFIESIHNIDRQQWNSLWCPQDETDYPFCKHEFLAALEDSGSTSHHTGWTPCHLVVKNEKKLIAALILYEKSHSYGEYVFDWAWADAYSRHGMNYYPKLVNAIPFTPTTGRRIALDRSLDKTQTNDLLLSIDTAIKHRLNEINGSGFHCLFPDKNGQRLCHTLNYAQRLGLQYHWFNQDYTSFDDFLNTFNSRKRKALKKERKKVEQHGLRIALKQACDVSDEEWQLFYLLYHRTYLKRSGRHGYLGESFFYRLALSLPDHTLLATVYDGDEFIAGALYLQDNDTLYGRYWGTQKDIDGLHFETCYYQGIEYAIKKGLARFDPGAQGEHKIQRGFTPVLTCSYHLLVQKEFHQAVENFVLEEKHDISETLAHARQYLPFKQGQVIMHECSLLTPTE